MPGDPQAREKWLLKKDLKLYKKYLRKASNKGDLMATFKLAMHSLNSSHGNKNLGITLMEKLIECQDEVLRLRSSYEYGKMLYEGIPIKKNQKKGMVLLLNTIRCCETYSDKNSNQSKGICPQYFHQRNCFIWIRKAYEYSSNKDFYHTLDKHEKDEITKIIKTNEPHWNQAP